MFTIDFAEDFSGLSSSQIKRLEDKGVITPEKIRGAKYYNYSDIYVLRLVRILRSNKIKATNISSAFEYLRNLGPDQPLSSYVLLHDSKYVYTVIDGKTLMDSEEQKKLINTSKWGQLILKEKVINASQWGQLVLDGIIELQAVGTELEKTRCRMNQYVSKLKKDSEKALKAKKKIYSIDELNQLLA